LIDAKKLAEKKGLDRCTYSEVNVEKPESLAPLVYVTDIVVSYVPAIFHHHIAKVCIDVGRNLVTASYISPELEKMHEAAIKKGLIFLNELGLDPGIDHLATMRTVD
jgi:saccharopine dehydrogenase-like NADP-dependent oxidoreductase